MAKVSYTYSITVDFPNGKVDINRLVEEIRSSSITIALDHIDSDATSVTTVFKADLSTDEKTTLDGIIADHSGEPLPTEVRLPDGTPIVTLHKRQSDGVSQMAYAPRVGSEIVIGTHNYCDKTTWFNKSVRVENQALEEVSGSSGLVFKSTNSEHVFWIDMRSGRMHNQEHWLDPNHGYQVHVYENGTELTHCEPFTFDASTGDYWIDYVKGEVHFFVDKSASTITASFSYATESCFIVAPQEGKTLRIEDAEADFSSDAVLTDKFGYIVRGYAGVFAPSYVQGSTTLDPCIDMQSDPPTNPNDGDRYIVYPPGTGDWVGYDGAVVQYSTATSSWDVHVPEEEDCTLVNGQSMYFTFRNGTWNPTPYTFTDKIDLQEDYYSRVSQIVTEARGAMPRVEAIGASAEHLAITDIREFRRKSRGMKHPVQAVPFAYATARDLVSSYGMELHVHTEKHREIEGEHLTLTFYCTSVDESSDNVV